MKLVGLQSKKPRRWYVSRALDNAVLGFGLTDQQICEDIRALTTNSPSAVIHRSHHDIGHEYYNHCFKNNQTFTMIDAPYENSDNI